MQLSNDSLKGPIETDISTEERTDINKYCNTKDAIVLLTGTLKIVRENLKDAMDPEVPVPKMLKAPKEYKYPKKLKFPQNPKAQNNLKGIKDPKKIYPPPKLPKEPMKPRGSNPLNLKWFPTQTAQRE